MKRGVKAIQWVELVWLRPYSIDAVWEMLTHLAALTPRGAVIFEARGRDGQMRYLIGADSRYIDKIKETIKPHGNITFYDFPDHFRSPVRIARQLAITKPTLSLNTEITMSVVRAGLAAMAAAHSNEETVLQVVLGGAHAPRSLPASMPDPSCSWLDSILGCVREATPECRKSARDKAAQYGFDAVIRIGSTSENAVGRMVSIHSALRTTESAGVRIHANESKPAHLNTAHVPWQFPSRLSVKELAHFLMLPVGEEELEGANRLHPKPLPPPRWYKNPTNVNNDRTFALSMNMANRHRLSIPPQDSLEHSILLGPTGSGKSTAMLNIILSDIAAGKSVLVIDPKADLINSILERIPDERTDDVVVIDPSDPCPVGFNPFAFRDYKNPELIADAILAVLKEIFSENWGITSQDVLSGALLTLVKKEGASLLWLLPLLTDDAFRQKITSQVTDRIGLKPFWEHFEALSGGERRKEIAPVMNKLRQFLLRKGLRNVLGQANPKFNLTDLFYKRRIVLVPLNKGIIGADSARLLGSLIVGLTWTLALSRASIPPERRHIVSVFIDELQDYLALPSDLSDALAQARGLGMALTLAHQYRDQLPPEIRAGIDANARNKIVFGLNSKDAKDMAAMAPELTQLDFMALPRYQVYTTFHQDGKNTGWIQGETLPAPLAIRDAAELKAQSMAIYGRPSEEVEEECIQTLSTERPKCPIPDDTPVGRRKPL